MTAERRAVLRQETWDAIALAGTIDSMVTGVEHGDVEALEAVKVLLERQLDRVDVLLLDLSRDRLDDERRGETPTDE